MKLYNLRVEALKRFITERFGSKYIGRTKDLTLYNLECYGFYDKAQIELNQLSGHVDYCYLT